MKVTVDFYPEGFGLMKKHNKQEKTFKDEVAFEEWCQKNYSKIGSINNYRTLGQSISHLDVVDALHGISM